MYHLLQQSVTICTIYFSIQLRQFARTVYLWFRMILRVTAIISLNNIDKLTLVMETHCVSFFEAGIGYFSCLKGLNISEIEEVQ
jgi:hypothetical protein